MLSENRVPRRAMGVVGVLLATAGLAACGEGGGASEGKPSGDPAKPSQTDGGKSARQAFDPPVGFEAGGFELPGASQPSTASGGATRAAVTLVDGVAYVTAESGLEATDTQTGKPRWTVGTKNAAEKGGFGSNRGAPRVFESGGKKTVYAAWNRTVPGEGTAPSRKVIEVLAVDTADGRTVWSGEFPAGPRGDGWSSGAIGADEVLAPQVIGVEAGVVVVTADDTTYAVDSAGGTVHWQKPDFRALVLADGVVAGGERAGYGDRRLVGVALATGEARWTVRDATRPAAAGPRLVTADRENRTRVLDAATGSERAVLDTGSWGCRHDARSLLLCSTYGSASKGAIVVFDATSVQKRWALPDASGRVVPKVKAFWHGAVYAETEGEKSVVLDGGTGQDRDTAPGAAPIEVDQYGGLTHSLDHPVYYRAVR
ncbi:PQQ-binding-like beta-propeller repeat protein [Streptomyces spororaveus]|uniref:outer membrane protein assembly factor BamB family protein n=1 Tax=Streptomyces spororaveus TaxID=284039 RepID=UPI00207A6202|nr:PQQ-binding-like beta-propeller repeat protein [Streptomyces spororaveus]MCM9076748.1 PQQ-like beta-propeller repeat protein [Streptomyces spororaveus]